MCVCVCVSPSNARRSPPLPEDDTLFRERPGELERVGTVDVGVPRAVDEEEAFVLEVPGVEQEGTLLVASVVPSGSHLRRAHVPLAVIRRCGAKGMMFRVCHCVWLTVRY